MFSRVLFLLFLMISCFPSMATTLSFESTPTGTIGQQFLADDVLFSTSSSNTLSIRSDCGTSGKCLASTPDDVLYGWLVVELPTEVNQIAFDYYTSYAKLWIAGHKGSPGIDAKVTEQYIAPSNWWRHAVIDSVQPFDFITFTTVTNDKTFNSRPSIWVDNLTFSLPIPVPEPSPNSLLIFGLSVLYFIRRKCV